MARGENIYKRKDGRWEGRYPKGRKSDGSIYYGYIYGKKYQMVREQVIIKRAVYQGSNENRKKRIRNQITFHDWATIWINKIEKKGIKPSTLSSYQNKIDVHLLPYFGHLKLRDISKDLLDEWVNEKSEILKISSIHIIFSLLKRCLKEAVDYDFLAYNICDKVCLPKWKKTKVLALSKCEQQKLTDYCEKQKQGMPILFALDTGLRIGEICGLQWRDVDFVDKRIYVRRTRQRVPSSLLEAKTSVIDQSPKTVSSERYVPLTKRAFRILVTLKKQANTEYVFSKRLKALEPRNLIRLFDQYKKTLGFYSITFHTLRHTFATRCIELGGNISSVSKLLGHSSIKMTLDIYTTSFYEEQVQTIQCLEKF